jgi:hypothetical protein
MDRSPALSRPSSKVPSKNLAAARGKLPPAMATSIDLSQFPRLPIHALIRSTGRTRETGVAPVDDAGQPNGLRMDIPGARASSGAAHGALVGKPGCQIWPECPDGEKDDDQ